MQQSITIQKYPALTDSSNYELLRKKGLEYIEQLGSSIWTDYNIHDPGITILELLSYAITDLGYRTSIDIKDLLAEPNTRKPKEDPKRQGFFTAREILTVNPWTNADFRKLLVDINGIKNAWLFCKQCACNDLLIYAKCSTSTLQYEPTEHPVIIKGFYDVLLEFENEAGAGDLNSGKVKYNFSFPVLNGFSTAMIEMRLPAWQQLQDQFDTYKSFRQPASVIESVAVQFISGNKNDNIDIPVASMGSVLRRPVYATIEVSFKPDKNFPAIETLLFSDIPMTVWFRSDSDRKQIQLKDIKQAIDDASLSGIFAKYLNLVHRADAVMQITNQSLHSHRNLSEDYCSIKAIAVEDIGVCADMDVEPSADIEAILAEAYYRIDQYFSPDIKFYSLKELMDSGVPVDEIFEGPALNNGFINNEQLDTTNLKTFIYTSDIINLLMDIPGVKNIKNFVLTKFDADGNLIKNEEWIMEIKYNHQPRLYLEASKILVFKNGLPFLPDTLELSDTLQVIKGRNAQPQYSIIENDLPVPKGKYFQLNDYYPLQYALPLTYGVGYDGLPSTASVERQAQAKQLKAYLLFYEQLLVNYLSQLTNAKELFALDTSVDKTYFSQLLDAASIKGADEIINGLTADNLQQLIETEDVFFNRRNRFLDHQLSRFAENFNEYALMLYTYSNSKAIADTKLIKDKINFLKDFPSMSANRAKAINYKDPAHVCNSENIAGLQLRIQRLLGLDAFGGFFELYEEKDADGVTFERRWRLKDETGKIQLSGSTRYSDPDFDTSEKKALAEMAIVKKYITTAARYDVKKVKKWVVNLTDETGEVIATRKQAFTTKVAADAARDGMIEFGKKLLAADKVYVVEHLLLRPRNIPSLPNFPLGDPLLTVCIPDDCSLCGDEDPYSFRLTVVLSGETGIANSGIEFRRFAEQTIRLEVPAHLGVKICWVSNEQFLAFETVYCDWLAALAKPEVDALELHTKLKALLLVFEQLKSVYPEARLHDCVDGDDSNRVFLDNTII
ncbi:MAG: hypothetical protein V4717_22755 [Bacteroidota bacterium]